MVVTVPETPPPLWPPVMSTAETLTAPLPLTVRAVELFELM